MKIVGLCPNGHAVTKDTSHPEQWLINEPIKTWCGFCNRLVGVTFKKTEPHANE
jgi:hypothetical protein